MCVCTRVCVPSAGGNISRKEWVWRRCGCPQELSRLLQEGGALGRRSPCQSPAHLVFIKDVENERGELGGVSKWEELLVDLLEAGRVQLPAGAVLDEAFVPEVARLPGEGG